MATNVLFILMFPFFSSICKLLQELAAEKQVALKKLQTDIIQDITKQGSLSDQQSEWLLKELTRLEDATKKIFANAAVERRRRLDEKLTKRKCLIDMKVCDDVT